MEQGARILDFQAFKQEKEEAEEAKKKHLQKEQESLVSTLNESQRKIWDTLSDDMQNKLMSFLMERCKLPTSKPSEEEFTKVFQLALTRDKLTKEIRSQTMDSDDIDEFMRSIESQYESLKKVSA